MRYFALFCAYAAVLCAYGFVQVWSMRSAGGPEFEHLSLNPAVLAAYNYSWFGRKVASLVLCPKYVAYESLLLWPRDASGNEIIPAGYDTYGWMDNVYLMMLYSSLGLAAYMFTDLLRGVMNGALYIERIKMDKMDADETKEFRKTLLQPRGVVEAIRFIL